MLNNHLVGVDALKAILSECSKDVPEASKSATGRLSLFTTTRRTLNLASEEELQAVADTVVQRFGLSQKQLQDGKREGGKRGRVAVVAADTGGTPG